MSFPSQYATRLWDILYEVLIPDQLTLDPAYVKRFGTHVTGDKNIDQMLTNNFTRVKITVIAILGYYEDGIEVQIPSREDMIKIHKDIELYLAEWREHLKFSINTSVDESKRMILSLEKLSKEIYNKAKPTEIIDNLFINKRIGLVSPLQRIEEERKPISKPDYEGIASLVKSKTTPKGRF